jgi:excisionase family DNA binding protein
MQSVTYRAVGNRNKDKDISQGGDPVMPEQLVTTKQAAKILAVAEKKVRELCARGLKYGGLEALKIGTKWRIPLKELDRFIESRIGRS